MHGRDCMATPAMISYWKRCASVSLEIVLIQVPSKKKKLLEKTSDYTTCLVSPLDAAEYIYARSILMPLGNSSANVMGIQMKKPADIICYRIRCFVFNKHTKKRPPAGEDVEEQYAVGEPPN